MVTRVPYKYEDLTPDLQYPGITWEEKVSGGRYSKIPGAGWPISLIKTARTRLCKTPATKNKT